MRGWLGDGGSAGTGAKRVLELHHHRRGRGSGRRFQTDPQSSSEGLPDQSSSKRTPDQTSSKRPSDQSSSKRLRDQSSSKRLRYQSSSKRLGDHAPL